MLIKPFPYQEKSINEIFEKFNTCNRVLLQLPTGAGKTFVFSFFAKLWLENYGGKILILCHREELINQTFASLNQIGITCETVTSKTKRLSHSAQVYIAMIESINNRLQKNPNYLPNVGLIINDECHILVFSKVFNYFKNAKILGCTATPVVLKKITFYKCIHCKTKYDALQTCCGTEVMEWTRPFTMSEIYEDIVVGASIGELIKLGNLVQEITFVRTSADTSNLKVDAKTGDYTEQSMTEAYGTDTALFNVVKNYEEIALGKKTIIFNPTSKVNLFVYQKLKEAGHNVRMYDSTNKELSGNRKALVKWFKETPDAILSNVNVFTTGFDVTDVEAILVNRKTLSLSLYHQMVGRGGRSTKLIYKDRFLHIDGGGNIELHNEWSDNSLDWRRIFFEGLSKEKEKSKKESIEDVQGCEQCGFLMPKNVDICPSCGFEHKPKVKTIKESESVAMPIRKIPPPNAERIYQYTLSQNEDANFAWRILINQVFDMFFYYRVTKESYIRARESGELNKKLNKMIRECYFILYSKSDLPRGTNRTIKYLIDKTLIKLEKHYGE